MPAGRCKTLHNYCSTVFRSAGPSTALRAGSGCRVGVLPTPSGRPEAGATCRASLGWADEDVRPYGDRGYFARKPETAGPIVASSQPGAR